MTDRQTTHAPGCWAWGPKHHECALREIETLQAEVERLKGENANLKTVMVAAAEEIHQHWDAHCDAEGYGPTNLIRRLEKASRLSTGTRQERLLNCVSAPTPQRPASQS